MNLNLQSPVILTQQKINLTALLFIYVYLKTNFAAELKVNNTVISSIASI